MPPGSPSPIRFPVAQVFISYRQLDDAQKQRVRAFAGRVRGCGIDVILDQFYLDTNPAGPPEKWPNWSSDRAISTEHVIIIGTEAWFLCFDNRQSPGTGLGAACEADDLRQRIYDAGSVTNAIRVVIFDDADASHISFKLKGYHYLHADRDFADIIRWLGGTPPASGPAASVATTTVQFVPFPSSPLTLDRDGYVDCDCGFAAFESMLSASAAKRVLLVHGHGNQGKSTLINKLYLHTRSILGTKSTARVEFKKAGSTPEEHVNVIARSLSVAQPTSGNIDDRVNVVLDACRTRPVVLFFDAYEHAETQHRHWVNRVLERCLDDDNLRCMVAGREIPPASAQPWGHLSVTVECDALKDTDAIADHAVANGYKGKRKDIVAFVNGLALVRERHRREGDFDDGISTEMVLDEIGNLCKGGGRLA